MWFVVYTMLKQKACLQLDNQGFSALFLSCKKEKITERKRVRASEILFSRHLFLNLQEEIRCEALLQLLGRVIRGTKPLAKIAEAL